MNVKFFLLSLLFSSVLCASNEKDALFEMSLEELMDIEVTASTKTKESILSVPASVTVFTRKQINNLGVTTLEELKNFVTGFASYRNESNSLSQNTITRGYSSGKSSRDVLVLIDGQRINNDWQGGSGSVDVNIALENMKKVEFIRGASSSIYGSNAFSGIISLTTIKGVNTLAVRGSDTSLNTSVLVSAEEGDLKVNAFVKKVMDKGQLYTNLTNYDPSPTASTRANDGFKTLDLYSQINYQDISIYLSYKEVDIEDFYVIKYLSNENKKKMKTSYARVEYTPYINNNYRSKLAASYVYQKNYFDINAFPQGQALVNIDEQTLSLEWFNDYSFSDTQSLQFGLEYMDRKMINTNATYPEISNTEYIIASENSRKIWSGYIQYTATFMDVFNLTTGVRYDNYSDFGDTANPRIGLVYTFLKNTSAKLLYSSAFRAPSRVESGVLETPVVIGNSSLSPEKINSYEAILVHKFESQTLSVSLFRNDMQNIITTVSTESLTYPDQVIHINNKNSIYDGFELEYSSLFFNTLSVNLGYSNIFNKPDDSFRAPKQIANAVVNYATKKYNLNISGYFHDEVKNDFAGELQTLKSYMLVNSKVAYNYYKKGSVFIYVKNLLDEEYFSPIIDSTLTVNLPNRGREIYLGFDYSF